MIGNSKKVLFESIYFEVRLQEDLEENNRDLSSNLRNGTIAAKQLAEELEDVVEGSIGRRPSFTRKGMSGAFTAEVEV